MSRTVFCEYQQRDAEGLDFVPWPGELGKRVFAHIGKPGWAAWLAHQTMLINENRLSPLDPQHRASREAGSRRSRFPVARENPPVTCREAGPPAPPPPRPAPPPRTG